MDIFRCYKRDFVCCDRAVFKESILYERLSGGGAVMNSVLLKLKGYTSEPLNRRAAVRRLQRIALALFRLGLFIGLS